MKSDIHFWRRDDERDRFFQSATFTLRWNGLRKSIKRSMSERGIKSIKLSAEGGEGDGKADL